MGIKRVVVCDSCGRERDVAKYKIQLVAGGTPKSRTLDLCKECAAPVEAVMGEPKRRARVEPGDVAEFEAAEGRAPAKRATKKASPSQGRRTRR